MVKNTPTIRRQNEISLHWYRLQKHFRDKQK